MTRPGDASKNGTDPPGPHWVARLPFVFAAFTSVHWSLCQAAYTEAADFPGRRFVEEARAMAALSVGQVFNYEAGMLPTCNDGLCITSVWRPANADRLEVIT